MALKRPKSLTEIVYDKLLDSIMGGQIPFGRLLSEKALAAEFGISKTPVREAFFHLQSVGLVEVLPQKGCLVFQPTIKQVEELCEVRIVLECAALRFSMQTARDAFLADLKDAHRAAEEKAVTEAISEYNRFDADFHRALFRHCDNATLTSAYEMFEPRVQALRVNLQSANGYLVGISVADHREILDRAVAGDVEGAEEMIGVHVRRMSQVYATDWNSLMQPHAQAAG